MQVAPQFRSHHIAPHFAKPQCGDWSVTVDELAWEGALIGDEVERLFPMELHYSMDGEYVPRDMSVGDRGGWAYAPVFKGVTFKGRYLSPRQCAEILPREIRIEANAAAERHATNLNDY